MADPVLIEPTLTQAGQAAAFNADNTGLELKITHASFGLAHYDPTGEERDLLAPVGSKVPLSGGSRPTPYQLRMVVSWREDVGEVPVGEIGFWSNDTLVFIWSKADGTNASYKTDGVTYVLFNDLTFAQVPAGSINVQVDPNESVALAALAAHEGSDNAHPQYLLRKDASKDVASLSWLGLAEGAENALVLTPVAAETVITTYSAGQKFTFMATATNTSVVTANIDGAGAVALRKAVAGGVAALEAGDISPGVIYDLVFNGTYFQLTGGGLGGSSSGGGGAGVGGSYTKDVGTVNTYKGTYLPAVTSLVDGLELVFLAKTTNTNKSTFSPNSLAAKPILDLRYAELSAGKIGVGAICTVRYLASLDSWVLTGIAGSGVPSTLAAYGITDAYTKAQVDAAVGTQAKVVGTPAVTGSSSVTAGTVVALTATAASLLTGGAIASFTWTLPDGTTSTVAASSGSASKSVTAIGSIGSNYAVQVYAIDTAGNKSAVTTKLIAITSHNAPTPPTVITTAGTIYQNSTGNTITISGSTASDGATLTYTINQSGDAALTFSKTSGIVAGESITFSAPAVAADTVVTLSAVAVDSLGGQSTAKTAAITVATYPTVLGVPFGGGYYAGRIKNGTDVYLLIVAPKASGETTLALRDRDGTGMQYSVWDGASNTASLLAESAASTTMKSPAAEFCKALNIGGFTDWAIPAENQLDLIYRTFKPYTGTNSTTEGANGNLDPVQQNYTAAAPAQTAIAAFKLGGAEAFTLDRYWTSTSYNGSYGKPIDFTDGYRAISTKTTQRKLRAVRMVKM
jgi:hypothetical protein